MASCRKQALKSRGAGSFHVIPELPTIRPERGDTAKTGVVLIDQFDFPQQTDSLVLANYESDQDIAGIPNLSL